MFTSEAPLLTVAEAAKAANVCPSTIRRRIHEGQLAAVKVGANRKAPLRIDRDEFRAWLYGDEAA